MQGENSRELSNFRESPNIHFWMRNHPGAFSSAKKTWSNLFWSEKKKRLCNYIVDIVDTLHTGCFFQTKPKWWFPHKNGGFHCGSPLIDVVHCIRAGFVSDVSFLVFQWILMEFLFNARGWFFGRCMVWATCNASCILSIPLKGVVHQIKIGFSPATTFYFYYYLLLLTSTVYAGQFI